MSKVKFYSQKEERLNIWSHGVGLTLSIPGLLFLWLKSSNSLSQWSALTFGVSMIILYAASTRYHSEKNEDKRARFRILDHAAIFILIAGTYTPFALISLKDSVGHILITVIWGIAGVGIILKLFFTGRFHLLSTILYVAMGWIAVFVVKPLIQSVDPVGLWLLAWGGVSYTLGAILYSIKRLPYNHAIFHFFVLIGSFLHYLAIYIYVID